MPCLGATVSAHQITSVLPARAAAAVLQPYDDWHPWNPGTLQVNSTNKAGGRVGAALQLINSQSRQTDVFSGWSQLSVMAVSDQKRCYVTAMTRVCQFELSLVRLL